MVLLDNITLIQVTILFNALFSIILEVGLDPISGARHVFQFSVSIYGVCTDGGAIANLPATRKYILGAMSESSTE